MASPLQLITDGFESELWKQSGIEDQLLGVSDEELVEMGCRAARAAVAPLVWSAEVGERWDVRRVTEFLDVSRQAVYKRVRTGSLLGLQGQGTTWFPVWQFDPERRVVRHVVGSIIEAFRRADAGVDPLIVAAWVTAPNRQLDGRSPAEAIAGGDRDERIAVLAGRAARGLAA